MYYLGTITGYTGAVNNQTTGLSGLGLFNIPLGTRSLYLVPSASGLLCEFGVATGPTGSTFLTTKLRGAQLDGPNLISGPFTVVAGNFPVVSIWTDQAGFVSVRVYASPGQ